MLNLHFVVTKKLDPKQSRFYSQLFNNRISGDYDDFLLFDKVMIDELLPKAHEFIDIIEKLIVEK